MVPSVLSDLSVWDSGWVTKNSVRGQRLSALFLVTSPEVRTDKSDNTQRNHALIVLMYVCDHQSAHVHFYITTSTLIEQCKMSNVPPQSKKRRLSLSLKGRRADKATSSSCRFATSTEEDVENAAKGVIPARRVNDWALRTFDEWIRPRSINKTTHHVPDDLLPSNSPEVVCKWLSKFVLEVRPESGESRNTTSSALYRYYKNNNEMFSTY